MDGLKMPFIPQWDDPSEMDGMTIDEMEDYMVKKLYRDPLMAPCNQRRKQLRETRQRVVEAQQEAARLRKENARLQAALEQYADGANWSRSEVFGVEAIDLWMGHGYGYTIAREALASTNANAIADSGGDGEQGEAQGGGE